MDNPGQTKKRRLNYEKCHYCRKSKKKCEPANRQWPQQKCNRCNAEGLACSDNQRAGDSSEPRQALTSAGEDVNTSWQDYYNLSLRVAWFRRLKHFHHSTKRTRNLEEVLSIFIVLEDYIRSEEIDITTVISSYLRQSTIPGPLLVAYSSLSLSHTTCVVADFQTQLFMLQPASQNTVDRLLHLGDLGAALAMQEAVTVRLLRADHRELEHDSIVIETQKYGDIHKRCMDRLGNLSQTKSVPIMPPLHSLLLSAHTEAVFSLIPRFPRQDDMFRRSLLHLALDLGIKNVTDSKVVPFLSGFLDNRDTWGRLPIHIACSGTHLIQSIEHPNARDYWGEGYKAVVELLLEKGADIEAVDSDGRTPLYIAAERGHEAVVKLLLEKGANIEAMIYSRTLLYMAAERGYEVVVKLLLEKGANIEAEDFDGGTPLWMAAFEGREVVVKLLLEKGADIEAVDSDGGTPLWMAALEGHEAVVKLLLEKGADIEAVDSIGRTPLYIAAEEGHEAVVKLLLEKDANIEAVDSIGRTPLYTAAEEGHEAVVKLLLEKGADMEAADSGGQTPLYIAAEEGHEAVVKLLLEKGADIEAVDSDGGTPLYIAAFEGREAVVKLLLDKDANIEAVDSIGRTPLYIAAEKGHEAVVKLLLEKDANIEAVDSNGRTPIYMAALEGHEAVVKLLLEKDASTTVLA